MAKTKTKGVTLSIGGAIGQVQSINGLGVKTETADVTELGDGAKQYLSTIDDLNEITAVVFYDPDEHDDVEDIRAAQQADGEPTTCAIAFPAPASKTYTFDAFLSGFEFEGIEPGGVIKATVTLRPTGDFS